MSKLSPVLFENTTRVGARRALRCVDTASLEWTISDDPTNAAIKVEGAAGGMIGLDDGTEALPSLYFLDDTNTGMWSPAADTIAWSVGGSEGMRLGTNLLVNTTTNLGGKLQVVGGIGAQLEMRNVDTDATQKTATFCCTHYTNAEEPTGIVIQGASSDNYIYYGGGVAQVNAATRHRFFAAANNTTTTGTEIARLTTAGLMVDPSGVSANAATALSVQGITLIGTNTNLGGKLQVVALNALECRDTDSDATLKSGAVSVTSYTNAEEPFVLAMGTTNSGSNTLFVGGGSASFNAATRIQFRAASAVNTVTGTEIARITTAGLRVEPGGVSGNAAYALDVACGTTNTAARFESTDLYCTVRIYDTGGYSEWGVDNGAATISNDTHGRMATFTTGGDVTFVPDEDATISLGRAAIHSVTSDEAHFCHYDQRASAVNYALKQSSVGNTVFNTGTGQDMTFALANVATAKLTAGGNFLLGTTTNLGGKFQVVGNNALELRNVDTDATNKESNVTVTHYTNAEEPLLVFNGTCTSSAGWIKYGGGHAGYNSATIVSTYAAANNTTTIGTEIIRVTTAGVRVEPGGVTGNAGSELDVAGTNSVYVQAAATNSNSWAGFIAKNDARMWRLEVTGTDDFRVFDVTGGLIPFVVADGSLTDSLKLSSTEVLFGATDARVSRSNAGGYVTLKVENTNTLTAGSSAELLVKVAGGGGAVGDPQVTWDVAGTDIWTCGPDTSDSNKWMLCNSGAIGTGVAICIDTSENCGFGTTSPAEDVHAADTVRADTAFNLNGTDGWTGSWENAEGSTVTVAGGIITDVS